MKRWQFDLLCGIAIGLGIVACWPFLVAAGVVAAAILH